MMSLGLTAKVGFSYRVPPYSRASSANAGFIPQHKSFNPLFAAALVASVAYVIWNKKEKSVEFSQEIPEVAFCKIDKIPSLKKTEEAKEIAFLLANSSDQSCQHIVYNLINTCSYDQEDVFDFTMTLSKETVRKEASPAAKECLVKWIYLLKNRYPGIYPEFIKALHNEGVAQIFFSDKVYRKRHENSRMMNELTSDYLALKLK